ncbi:MAG: hypothetical protein AAFW69_11305 [Pseudomonadota bacterium]
MRPPALLLLLAALAACASPGPEFQRSAGVEMIVEGWTLHVFRAEDKVQVIRTTATIRQSFEGLLARAAVAVPAATGCELSIPKARGDGNVLTSELIC